MKPRKPNLPPQPRRSAHLWTGGVAGVSSNEEPTVSTVNKRLGRPVSSANRSRSLKEAGGGRTRPTTAQHQNRSSLAAIENCGSMLNIRELTSASKFGALAGSPSLQKASTKPSLQDQLNDLQIKELNLEKAKTDLWLQAEFQRHQRELDNLKHTSEEQLRLCRQQHEEQIRLMEKEHAQEIEKERAFWAKEVANKEIECETSVAQTRENSEGILREAREAHLKEVTLLKAEVVHVQKNALQSQEGIQQQSQEALSAALEKCRQDERAAACRAKLQLKQALLKQRDKQIREVCSKIQEEQFAVAEDLKIKLKEERWRLQGQIDQLKIQMDSLRTENAQLLSQNESLRREMTTMVKIDREATATGVQTESVLQQEHLDQPLWKHQEIQTKEEEFPSSKQFSGVGVQAEMVDVDLLLKEQEVHLQKQFDQQVARVKDRVSAVIKQYQVELDLQKKETAKVEKQYWDCQKMLDMLCCETTGINGSKQEDKNSGEEKQNFGRELVPVEIARRKTEDQPAIEPRPSQEEEKKEELPALEYKPPSETEVTEDNQSQQVPVSPDQQECVHPRDGPKEGKPRPGPAAKRGRSKKKEDKMPRFKF